MSIVKLINLNKNIILGKAAKVTSPSVAVGGKIISDAFGGGKIQPETIGGGKIQPKGISEVKDEGSYNKTMASAGGTVWHTLVSKWILSDEAATELITVNSRVNFRDDSGAAAWTLLYVGVVVFLDDEQFREHRTSVPLNPDVGITHGFSEITNLVHMYSYKGQTGFKFEIKAYCVSLGATANRYAEITGDYVITELKR